MHKGPERGLFCRNPTPDVGTRVSDLVFTVDVDTKDAIASINNYFETVKQGAKNAGQALRAELGDRNQEVDVVLNFKNGKIVAQEMKRVETTTDKVAQAYKAVNGELGKTPAALKTTLRVLQDLRSRTVKYYKDSSTKAKLVSEDWKTLTNRIVETKKQLNEVASLSVAQKMSAGWTGLIEKLTIANLAANAIQSAFNSLTKAISATISTGLEMEQLSLVLKGFTGSVVAAETAMASFIDIAVKTPLDVQQVAQAGKTLLAFGISAEEAMMATERLAIVAGATGGDLNNLSRNLGQISAQGRAYTRDLNQFAVQGIPIYQELANVMGVSVEKVREMAEEGQVGLSEVTAALKNMTKEGSAFKQISDEMQNTWQGQIEAMVSSMQVFSGSLVEAVRDFDNTFGAPIQKTLKLVADLFAALAKNMNLVTQAAAAMAVGIATVSALLVAINIGPIIAGLVALAGKYYALAAAAWASAKALAATLGLTGPAGWAILAAGVAAAGVAFAALRNSAEQTINPLNDARESIMLMNGEVDPSKMTAWGSEVTSLQTKSRQLKEDIDQLSAVYKLYSEQGLHNKEVSDKLAQKKKELLEVERALKALVESGGGRTEEVRQLQEALLAQQQYNQAKRDELKAAQDLANDKRAAYEQEKTELSDLQGILNQRYSEEQDRIKERISIQKEAISEEKAAYNDAKAVMKDRHDSEMSLLDQKYDRVLDIIQAEIDGLNQKSPAEQALYDLRKKELQEKLKSAELTQKEKLEIQAQLERMQRREKIEQLRAQKKQTELQKENEITAAKNRQLAEEQNLKKEHESRMGVLEAGLQQEEQSLVKINAEQAALNKKLEEANDPTLKQYKTLNEILVAVQKQIKEVDTAKNSYDRAERAAADLTTEIEDGAKAAKDLQIQLSEAIKKQNQLTAAANRTASAQSSSNNRNDRRGTAFARAEGGPVTGGTAYQVNELGKEAFLSASGRLSMINAPAYGKWRAPSSGTVIPAHLTKQLDVPSGGIDLSSAPAHNSAKISSGNSLSGLIRAIHGLAGGDNIQNSVTIQSATPTQTASDMLVQLNRIKRRRIR